MGARGYSVSDIQNPKKGTSGLAQVFKLNDHPTLRSIQFSGIGEKTHGSGQYYKFTLNDGSKVKVIDPANYKHDPTEKGVSLYMDFNGQKVDLQAKD